MSPMSPYARYDRAATIRAKYTLLTRRRSNTRVRQLSSLRARSRAMVLVKAARAGTSLTSRRSSTRKRAKLAAPVPVMVGALLKLSIVVLTFLTVTDRVLLVVTVPKASEAGDRVTSVPVPLNGNCSDVAPFGSPVKFAVTVPVIVPSDVGVKATLNAHV